MLVTCSIGRTSHQSLILYTVARLDTRWRDIEDGNGLPVTVSDIAIYSASVEERATVFCFRETQHTAPPAKVSAYPVTDTLVSRSVAQSASENAKKPCTFLA